MIWLHNSQSHSVQSTEDKLDVSRETEQAELQEEVHGAPTIQKRRPTAGIVQITRMRNELAAFKINVENMHVLKTSLAQYYQLWISYQEAHTRLYDALTIEDDQ